MKMKCTTVTNAQGSKTKTKYGKKNNEPNKTNIGNLIENYILQFRTLSWWKWTRNDFCFLVYDGSIDFLSSCEQHKLN